jgi:hypothetical protein
VRAGGAALGGAVAVPEEVGARHEAARRRGQRVRAVPVAVPRARRVRLTDSSDVALVEVLRADQLPANSQAH